MALGLAQLGGRMHLESIVLALLQVVLIIGLSRLVGLGFRRLKQPLVMGEILAGILLGPSLLGLVAPEFAAHLFPEESIQFLRILKDVGLIFFMFLIGLELDPQYLKGNLNTAVLVSHVSILVPFSLGLGLAAFLYPLVANAGVSFTAFALFLGAALSITAFPVLARILTEKNLQSTKLGTLALTCAAVDDVTAWCLLALAISVTRTNSMVEALPVIARSLIYIAFVLLLVRPLLGKIAQYYSHAAKLGQSILALIYCCVLLSAVTTELIGIHLIFGAFLIGAVMPKATTLTKALAEKTEDFVLIVLLPIFFAYSGLKTQIGLLNSWLLWGLCGLVVVVAIAGKYIGTYISARVSGIEHRDASALGWLMNTRGLTELIVLNIGLSLGVITPLLFTMLVIMALVTTVMTSPLLELTYLKPKMLPADPIDPLVDQDGYRILVLIANPNSASGLLDLAANMTLPDTPDRVYPMSLVQMDADYQFESTPLEVDRQITERRNELQQTIDQHLLANQVAVIVELSQDVAHTTKEVAQRENIDLILLGWHRPAFSGNRLGGRVGQILRAAAKNVAVYVDRPEHSRKLQRILLPYQANPHTELALKLAIRLLTHDPTRELSILRLKDHKLDQPSEQILANLPEEMQHRVATPILQTQDPLAAVVDASVTADLVIVGIGSTWGIARQSLGRYTDELAVYCQSSLLITRARDHR
jgi:Kef-type K+ transport system membrane component KefB/nucleotide-binding universal stress UspA family protein